MIHATPPRLSSATRVPTAKTEAPEPIARTEAELGAMMLASVAADQRAKKTAGAAQSRDEQVIQRRERIVADLHDWTRARDVCVAYDVSTCTAATDLKALYEAGQLERRKYGKNGGLEYRRIKA